MDTGTTTAALEYRIGDATRPDVDGPWVLAHCCNDQGKWGAGFSGAISRRWAHAERPYQRWFWAGETHNHGERRATPFALGRVQFMAATGGWIANIIGQHRTLRRNGMPPIRYAALEMGLGYVASWAIRHGASVHMPLIGAGLAGGDWAVIEPMIERTLVANGIDVTVYLLPIAEEVEPW